MDNDVIYRNVFAKASIPDIAAAKRRPLSDDEVKLVTSTYTGHRMGVPRCCSFTAACAAAS